MTTCTYTRCDTPTADGQALCHADTNRLRDILGWIPDALDTLADTVARMDRTGSDGGSSSGDHAEAVNVDALDAKIDLEERVGSWARMVLEADTSNDLRNVPPLTYLRLSIDLIRTQDYAGDMLEELSEALRKVTRAADLRSEVRTLGPCGTDDCTGIIRAAKGSKVARCRECGERYDVNAIEAWRISEAWEVRAPLATVIRALNEVSHPIRQATARKWVERGKLVADQRGMFTMADVYHVYVGMKEKAKAS